MLSRRIWLFGTVALTPLLAAVAYAVRYELAKRQFDEPVGADVLEELKGIVLPLETTEPDRNSNDLDFLQARLARARIVSLGEATHGSHEFFQLKHRIIEFCVAKLGFTVVAFEANYGETLHVNDYVLGGEGPAAEAVARIGLVFWNTVEVVRLVQWLRTWNDTHDRKVKFYGLDMQWGAPEAEYLLNYLRKVSPELAKFSEAALAPAIRSELMSIDATAQQGVIAHIKAVLEAFDRERADWVRRLNEMDWRLARLSAVVVGQKTESMIRPSLWWRDRCMADNLHALLEAEGPDAKALVWAHNAHVKRAPNYFPEWLTMGGFLNDEFGGKQVVIGFSFNQGGFRAVAEDGGQVVDQSVGPAPAGFVDATLAAMGLPLLAFDLHRIPPEGPVASWMASKPLQRSISGIYAPPPWYRLRYWVEVFYATDADDPRANYDMLLFVERTTRSIPVYGSGLEEAP